MIAFAPATLAHARALADTMRHADRAEVEAAGYAPLPALALALETSSAAWTALDDGLPICCWGVQPINILAGTGMPWLLGGIGLDRHRKAFLRESRARLPALTKGYTLLQQMVDARYAGAVRWVRWLGFDVGPAVPVPPHGVPFHLATLRC